MPIRYSDITLSEMTLDLRISPGDGNPMIQRTSGSRKNFKSKSFCFERRIDVTDRFDNAS
jgi:hypothetical protein